MRTYQTSEQDSEDGPAYGPVFYGPLVSVLQVDPVLPLNVECVIDELIAEQMDYENMLIDELDMIELEGIMGEIGNEEIEDEVEIMDEIEGDGKLKVYTVTYPKKPLRGKNDKHLNLIINNLNRTKEVGETEKGIFELMEN